LGAGKIFHGKNIGNEQLKCISEMVPRVILMEKSVLICVICERKWLAETTDSHRKPLRYDPIPARIAFHRIALNVNPRVAPKRENFIIDKNVRIN